MFLDRLCDAPPGPVRPRARQREADFLCLVAVWTCARSDQRIHKDLGYLPNLPGPGDLHAAQPVAEVVEVACVEVERVPALLLAEGKEPAEPGPPDGLATAGLL